MSALRQLTIKDFRGAMKLFVLRFDPAGRLTLIYGENGSGKSTICDALEFVSRGRVGSLDDRGLGTTTRYWPALGKSYNDIAVTLDSDEGAEAKPRVEVFRRAQILSLIEAKPSERYAAISRFIDVSGIEASETALRELIRDLGKQRDGAATRLDENDITIRQFWETAESPGTDPFTWAAEESNRNTDEVEAEITAIRSLQSAYSRLSELPARLRSAQQALATAKSAAEAAGASVRDQLEGASREAGEIVTLLQAATGYLAVNPSPSVCPMCESSEHAADLTKRIRERLDALSSLQTAQAQAAAAAEAVRRAEQQLQLVRENARQDVAKFEACRTDRQLPADMPLPEAAVLNSASALTGWLNATSDLAALWKKAETARHDKKHFISTLKQALDTWRVNGAALADLNGLLPRLERTLKIVEEERRRFTDDILAAIAADVSRLYDLVHPGEGLNKIRLELDPKRRASLEIGAHFFGQPTRPQGYFSESHLDTLGLCVFLALSALEEPENTIVVLDDILSSVDDAHAQRLLALLASEATRFRHIVVTTHSRLWSKSPDYQVVELGPWSQADGLSLNQEGLRR